MSTKPDRLPADEDQEGLAQKGADQDQEKEQGLEALLPGTPSLSAGGSGTIKVSG